jgi:hypothetical protein
MSYPAVPQPRQNPQVDPRQYQARAIRPNVRVEPPITKAPTFGQYMRSDTRVANPGDKKPRWAGMISFWLGVIAAVLFYIVVGILSIAVFIPIAAAFSVVAIFFGLVAFVAGLGRGFGFFGILLALAANFYVLQWLGIFARA